MTLFRHMAEPIILVQQQERSFLEALAAFAHQQAGWRLVACSDRTLRHAQSQLQEASGIITATRSTETMSILSKSKIPWINVRYTVKQACSVICDERAIGRLAGAHFKQLGLKHIAYLGSNSELLAGLRSGSNQQQVFSRSRLSTQTQAKNWLRTLPRPSGIFCENDGQAVDVINAALDAGFQVPEDFAVCGNNNNTFQALCSAVPLSSIDPNHAAMGTASAQLLFKYIQHGKALPKKMLVTPKELVKRRSTDAYFGLEPSLALAVRLMHGGLLDGISIEDVISECGISRSTLERQFHVHFKQSPGTWLKQQRLEAAARLLLSENTDCESIAVQCGFNSASHFSRAFKKRYKCTPLQWRQAKK